METARPLPTVIGPTENALRALLARVLSTTRIRTYSAWVVMNIVDSSDDAAEGSRHMIADALKAGLDDVDRLFSQLATAGLVGNDGLLTPLGQSELSAGRKAVSSVTTRLIDGISDEDQATARLVLDHVRRKAEEQLQL